MALHTNEKESDQELFSAAASKVRDQLSECLKNRGSCFLGIVGGRAIPGLLEELVPLTSGLSGRIDVFWLDERVSDDKNYLQAERLLTKIRSNLVQIFWHPLKSTNKDEAQIEANKVLRHMDKLNRSRGFDIIILSAGEDGHIASIFPKKKTLNNMEKGYVLEDNSPKPPPLRITVTPGLLLTAKHGHLFFVGDKQKAYINFLDPGTPLRDCPAKLLNKLPDLTIHVKLNK